MPQEAQASTEAFPTFAASDWNAAVAKALKGASFEKLIGRAPDGYRVEPLYSGTTATPAIAARAAARPWTVTQRIEHPDPAVANRLLVADLEGGAGAAEIVFAGSVQARPHGLPVDPAGFDSLFAGVFLDMISLRIDAGEATVAAVRHLADLALARGHAADRLDVSAVLDPLGLLAARGRLERPVADHVADAADLLRDGLARTVLEADGRAWHAAGATDGQELAAVLATAVHYWRGLAGAGTDLATAAAATGFTLAADQEQFRTIAKMRALRRLWWRVQSAAGITPVPARLHAETAWRTYSRVGPQVNLIRASIACFAAGVGGADSVTVLPFTSAVGLPDAFARRLARNTQTILIEESNLYRVTDPAAGSGLVEAETTALAEAAWAIFQAAEAAGGMAAAVASGFWADRIAAAATERAALIAKRRQPLTGVSEFPDIGEAPVAVLEAAMPPAPAPGRAAETAPALPAARLSEAFEVLRDAAEAKRRDGRPPSIFLANLGRIPDFNARSTWAKNFFEAGGILALGNDGFPDLDALVEAFRASGTTAACLCSSDTVYAETAVATAGALRAAGATQVYLAGKPAEETAPAYAAAGIGPFVHVGIDVVAALAEAQRRLGVA